MPTPAGVLVYSGTHAFPVAVCLHLLYIYISIPTAVQG